MTTRKPPNLSVPDWIERQIRTAEADGAFDNLPGAGKPIPDIDRPQHELAWVANYLRRENVDTADLLPPALALAKEVETLPERLVRERSEARARALVDDLNERIDQAYARPQVGPPLRVKKVKVDAAMAQWHEMQAALAAAAPALPAVPAPDPVLRRRWLRRAPR
jgi:Domain of unknown function (DUF1992)